MFDDRIQADGKNNLKSLFLENLCSAPPAILNQQSVAVKRKSQTGRLFQAKKPYKYEDYAYYQCKSGYKLVPDVPRRCHARKGWTHNIKCVGRFFCYVKYFANFFLSFLYSKMPSSETFECVFKTVHQRC